MVAGRDSSVRIGTAQSVFKGSPRQHQKEPGRRAGAGCGNGISGRFCRFPGAPLIRKIWGASLSAGIQGGLLFRMTRCALICGHPSIHEGACDAATPRAVARGALSHAPAMMTTMAGPRALLRSAGHAAHPDLT
ncbi:hypothetical protein MRX96_024539 [Rhipicephalus microplus]